MKETKNTYRFHLCLNYLDYIRYFFHSFIFIPLFVLCITPDDDDEDLAKENQLKPPDRPSVKTQPFTEPDVSSLHSQSLQDGDTSVQLHRLDNNPSVSASDLLTDGTMPMDEPQMCRRQDDVPLIDPSGPSNAHCSTRLLDIGEFDDDVDEQVDAEDEALLIPEPKSSNADVESEEAVLNGNYWWKTDQLCSMFSL